MAHGRPMSPWVSAPRMMVLATSFFVALGSGTNYVFPAYSPQLGARLKISHTQLNIIALAGNAGVYSSVLLWGRIVDSRGPRILLIIGFSQLLSGYFGIKYLYDSGLPPDTNTLSDLSFYILVLCSFVTGSGGAAGLTGCINATVKSFPDGARASTAGLVMAGFGLSALVFTTIANTVFRSTTSTFLLILALGTSCLMALGSFFVRPIPLPHQASYQPLEDSDDTRETLLPDFEHHNNSRTTLLNDDSMKDRHARYTRTDISTAGEHSNSVGGVVEVARSPGRKCSTPNVHGKALFRSLEFWLMFSIFSMLAGTGYTYINNVGSMSQSLYAHNNGQYDEAQALMWQATQVSVFSITNSGGRMLIGFFSDFAKILYKMPRSYSLILIAFVYFISQVVAATVTNHQYLKLMDRKRSTRLGSWKRVCHKFYSHFSENVGYICISPIISANLLAFLFGRNLDVHGHKVVDEFHPSAFHVYAQPQCLQGRVCYVNALYWTIGATLLSLILSIWAGYRDSQKAVNEGDTVGEER